MTTDLAVIEAALEAATPGPWVAVEHSTIVQRREVMRDYLVAMIPNYSPETAANRDLIVLLRNTAAELVERVKAAEWATTVQQCSVSHEDPYDFDYCETHDQTFPIGGKCDHAGISELDYWVDQASTQRGRSVGAEMRAETAEATIARVRELAEQHPGTAWNSGLNLRQALRDALGGTPTDAPEGAKLADDERNRFSGENTDGARKPIGCSCRTCNPDSRRMIVCATCGNKRCPHASNHAYQCTWSNEPDQKPILRPTDQRYEPPAVDDESGCCR